MSHRQNLSARGEGAPPRGWIGWNSKILTSPLSRHVSSRAGFLRSVFKSFFPRMLAPEFFSVCWGVGALEKAISVLSGVGLCRAGANCFWRPR